jgi:hypothetical protein
MSEIQRRSVLTSPGDVSTEYPVGNCRDNSPGMARVSLAGSWTGGVTLRNSLGDGVWVVVKTYGNGPEDDIAVVCGRKESFRFEAEPGFSGTASVIVTQGEALP